LAQKLKSHMMTNHDIKDDPILEVSSQEPSTSSKYDFKDWGFLTQFFSCWRAEIWHTEQESRIMTIHDDKEDPILPSPQSGTFDVLQV
jgi:hypothetical protein